MELRLEELLQRGRSAATAPSGMILEGFRNPQLQINIKPDGSVITRCDREAERLIRELLAPAGPWPLLGEEFGLGESPYEAPTHRWVLDFARARLAAGFECLMRAGTHLRGCHDCWSHAMAARGAVDVLVELGLNRWDIAATEVIMEEAGGACRLRPSHYGAGKFDAMLGKIRAVDAIARIIGFDSDPAA